MANGSGLAKSSIRRSVLGADRGLCVIESGPPPAPPDDGGEPEKCPIAPLGHLDGTFFFLDARGQKRELSARQLGSRHDMVSLFGGNDAWLREAFPKRVQDKDSGEWITVDFKINEAAAALQRACFSAGLWGEHIILRKPGVWRDADGLPVVHCGDAVLIGDKWVRPGARTGSQIWSAAAPVPRPGLPCVAAIGCELHAGLKDLWNFREVGGSIAMMGLIANAYFGAAIEWRPAGFITGSTGAGKSALLRIVRAALPLHHHSNDASKAGIEQAVHGRAMAIIIDEAADRANRSASRDLIDLVLSAAGDEGTKGSRGTLDGKGRRIEVAGLIIMFSINPPELEPQHLGRFTIIDLKKPTDGHDHRLQHRKLEVFARAHAAELWARALAGWDRYNAALDAFRHGLGAVGCAPREMDQAGALLAGWWLMVHEGVPDECGVAEGIAALDPTRESGFIRLTAAVDADDRPQRMLEHLLSSMIMLHRSTDRAPVGTLIEVALSASERRDDARKLLSYYGIRVVRPGDTEDSKRPVPRVGEGGGLWLSATSPELRKLFAGTPFEGTRWQSEMARLAGVMKTNKAVRIGGTASTAFWLPLSSLPQEKWEAPDG